MSTQVHAEQVQDQATTETEVPAAGGEGSAAQGSSGSESTEGTPSPGESSAAEGGEEDEAAKEAALAAAFKPREKFKYRVFGSEEQKEEAVPEWLKGALKDAETEKQAIELLEKAYGLEPVKAARAEVAKERDHFKGEFTKVQSSIADVRKTYQRGDIDSFLDKLQIPHERMLQWALDKVNYTQLPPEQQRMIDERREAQRAAWSAEERAMQLESGSFEQARTAKQTSLQLALNRPDVSSFAQAFDQRAGRPGAFFEEVCATGDLAWTQSQGKEDLSPDQAIERVIKKWGAFVQPQASAAAAPTAASAGSQAGPGTQAAPTQKTAPVIPNVQGRTTSPMKSKPRSIEDLKKLRAQA